MDLNKLSQGDLKQIATLAGVKVSKSKKDTIAKLVSYFKSFDITTQPKDDKNPSPSISSEPKRQDNGYTSESSDDHLEIEPVAPEQPKKPKGRIVPTKEANLASGIKTDKDIPYVKVESINGSGGKAGSCFKVKKGRGHKLFVMKTYKSSKSTSALEEEIHLQNLASKKKLAPTIRDGSMEHKYIVMDMLDTTLKDLLTTKGGLDKHQQKELLKIHQHLDKAGVFHGSPKLTNYMYKEDLPYIIDFGFAKPITQKLCDKLDTETPNETVMTAGLIINLKKENYPSSSYDVLLKALTKKEREQYNLL